MVGTNVLPRPLLAAAAALTGSLLLLPRTASACGADPMGPHITVPVHGQAPSAPLNVRVGLMLWPNGRGGGAFEDAQLLEGWNVPGGGTPVATRLEVRDEAPAGVRRAWLVPTAPLKPSQEYTVRSGSFTLAFRTGTSLDEAPPPSPVGTQARMELRTKEPNDCDSSRGQYGVLVLTPPEPGEPVSYTVREGGRALAADLTAERLQALVACEAGVNVGAPESLRVTPGPHTLELVAVDLAGNASAPATLEVQASCTGDSLSMVPPIPPAPPEGGCTSAAGGGLSAAGGVLLALGLRRRRQRG